MEDLEDPLVKALPPATDYLSYLTILEYQLTPARLPTLHRLLQDETLTTNIGWDLVQLLLPLLPASEECLQDISRLGNPREVILRVSDALMTLHPSDDEGISDHEEQGVPQGSPATSLHAAEKRIPLHILQFNSLVSMLATLHSRIKTKYPSRFIATSLHAALEAYTEYPTVETTAAILEFLRDISGNKRPALPPRNAGEQLVPRVTRGSAPDPEAEPQSDNALAQERTLTQRLVQFGLIEVLKAYLLSCTDEQPPGMQWALRVQERLDPGAVTPGLSLIEHFNQAEYAKERDSTMGKIIALSRDFGLDTKTLLQVVLNPVEDHDAPLDFEAMPKSPEDIPLERHGCLILLSARCATAALFGSTEPKIDIPMYPDISIIFANFLGNNEKAAAEEQIATPGPGPLLDSLLALALTSSHYGPDSAPQAESDFNQLILAMVTCVRAPPMRPISRIEKIPSEIFRANPNAQSRYNLILQIFHDEGLKYAKESALNWLKQELLDPPAGPDASSPFTDVESFATLFKSLYSPPPDDFSNLPSSSTQVILIEWIKFTSREATFYILALNFYYFLCRSEALREKLQLQTLVPEFTENFLLPVKKFAQSIRDDAGVSETVERELDESIRLMGESAADVVLHVIGEIEKVGWKD
ncbi:uncharacterized protein CIMG_09485 [Coccidioides immitis RS]|uniref:DUF1760-domain-containing protein n=3 Tax=Coccidioides immitis TaxID=5501 RepID=A0A0E1RVA3_COCIM|nr:uncharacterized protein CIMG_09485 [Coccidioides immitis RS]EAS28281.1 hypothetical protein CIMG_09485 [Coccidioides immitis RS]KMU81463.1 hypothetical protein CISG_09034 [Coccidioides immitis RMSCC 3703]KMU85917.1 hypothetical protein CIHG_03446 [Coccidioides immitis H538.4]TPX20922.1 hypothetical protein DIZ76_016819 [Coccidioides immitis]